MKIRHDSETIIKDIARLADRITNNPDVTPTERFKMRTKLRDMHDMVEAAAAAAKRERARVDGVAG